MTEQAKQGESSPPTQNEETSEGSSFPVDTKKEETVEEPMLVHENFIVGRSPGLIFAHSLAFPSTFGDQPEHYTADAILKHWKSHTPELTAHRSFGQVVCEVILDKAQVPLFAEGIVLHELNKKIPAIGMLYNTRYKSCPLDWHNIFFELHRCATFINFEEGNIPIVTYMKVSKIVADLSSFCRPYFIELLENRIGKPLEKMAEIAELSNVKYVMKNLKLANAIPLFHQLFASPTYSGKLTAFIRIIELYDVMWEDVHWTGIEKLAEFLLKIWDWLMTKTRLAADFAEAKFKWVKAKFSKNEPQKQCHKQPKDPRTVCNVARTILDGCENDPAYTCQLCLFQGCEEHKKDFCQCPSKMFYVRSSTIGDNQDCLFRALSKILHMNIATLKSEIYNFVENPESAEKYVVNLNRFPIEEQANFLSFDDFRLEILRQLKSDVMCECDMLLAAALTFDIGIYVTYEGDVCGFEPKKYGDIIHLTLTDNHYSAKEPQFADGLPTKTIWGTPYIEVEHNLDHSVRLTSKPYLKRKKWVPLKVTPRVQKEPVIKYATVKADDLESVTSETSTDTTTETVSSNSDIDSTISRLTNIASNRTTPGNSDPAFDKAKMSHDNYVNSCVQDEKTIWELLKECEFNEVGRRVGDFFRNAAKSVLMFFEENPLMTGLISVVVAIAAFLGINVTFLTGATASITLIKKLTDASRTMYYAERGMTSIITAFSKTMDVAKDMLGVSKNQAIDDFKKEVAAAHKIALEMLSIASHRPGDFINDGAKFLEFKKNIESIEKVYKNLASMKNSRDMTIITPIWNSLSRTYEKLRFVYDRMMNSAMTRQEPVVVYFWGPTAYGKSMMISKIIQSLNKSSKKNMKVFTLSKGPEYWNGFAQQDIIRVDDMNAIVGPEGDIDSVAMFNLATSAPYNPNMAHLDDKTIMATPKFVFINSNHPSIPTNSCVMDREAWERRRDFLINVSWPGHEDCKVGSYNCPHWTEVKKKVAETGKITFDHLKLTMVDPVIGDRFSSSSCSTETHTKGKKNNPWKPVYPKLTHEEVNGFVQEGSPLTFDTLIQAIIGKELENRANYEAALREAAMDDSKQVNSWKVPPIVWLLGPPGTGKSYIMNRARELSTFDQRNIVTLEDFNKFAEEGFKNVKPCQVFLNDLSLFISSEHFATFLDKIMERYDDPSPPSETWIIGANLYVLEQKLSDMGKTEEYWNALLRRGLKYYASYKKKKVSERVKGIFNKKASKLYTFDDIDPNHIDEYVEYSSGLKKFSQETVAAQIAVMKPEPIKIVKRTKINSKDSIETTSVLSIDITSAEFIEMVNDLHVFKIISFLRSDRTKLNSSTMDVSRLIKCINSMLSKCRGMRNTTFDSIEGLLLQAWNENAFTEFKDEVVILNLKDKKFYIDARNIENVDVGHLTTTQEKINEVVESLGLTIKQIELSDFMQQSSILPHWLVLCGEIISTIFSMSATAVSAVLSVQDQHEAFKAQEWAIKVDQAMREGHIAIQGKTLASLETGIARASGKPPLYPGVKNIKSPQFADIVTDPLYHEGGSSSETGDNRQHARGFKVRKDTRDALAIAEGSPSETSSDRKNAKGFRVIREGGSPSETGDSRKSFKATLPQRQYVYDTPKTDVSKTFISKEVLTFQCDRTKVSKANSDELSKQVVTDPTLYPVIDKILKNCVEIIDTSGTRLCSGLAIRGRCITTVAHLLETCSIRNVRVKTLDGKTWPVEILFKDEQHDRLDLRVTDVTMPFFPDIRNHFPTMTNNMLDNSRAVLVTPYVNFASNMLMVQIRQYMINNVAYRNFKNYTLGLYAIEYKGHRVGYTATGVETKYGDCGSILILIDPAWQDGKVIGMHVAATPSLAYARPFRRSYYEDRENIQFQSCPSSYVTDTWFETQEDPDDPQFRGVCKVRNHIPSKTKLFANWIPIGPKVYEPAVLGSEDPRGNGTSVLRNESMKWCIDREGFDSTTRADLSECMKHFAYHYVATLRKQGVTLKTLTSTEALNKLTGTSASEPINTHTSAGFPFNKLSQAIGKTGYITVAEDGVRRFSKDERSKKCVQFLMEEINKLEHEPQGRHSDVIFQVYLKDELRKLKKIKESSTRTIATAPLHFTIVYRKYLHSAHAHMMENWHAIGPKVGISPLSLDWHTLMTNLLSVSTHGIDLDFKGWDFSHNPYLIGLLPEFYRILYTELDPNCTENDHAIRNALYSKIKNFHILVGNDLYQSTGGIPSGYPGTSMDNSLLNEFMHYYIFYKIMKNASPHNANITSFYELVSIATYGDDVTAAIDPWAAKHYNGVVLQQEFARLGFKAQSTDKDSEVQAIRPIHECTFLARSFKLMHGFWVGPLKRDNLFKPTHYSSDRRSHHFWKSPDEKIRSVDIVQGVYESILYNAAIDSREIFDQVYTIAQQIMDETNGPVLPSYEDCLSRMFGFPLASKDVEGVEMMDMTDITKLQWKHELPTYYRKFANRTSYHFGPDYTYLGSPKSNPMPKNMKKILDHVNFSTGFEFNSILVNIYPPGGEIPWHKDDEPELDLDAGVLGVTMEGDGQIEFKDSSAVYRRILDPGDGYYMTKENLENYHHRRVEHSKKTTTFTFRKIVPRTDLH